MREDLLSAINKLQSKMREGKEPGEKLSEKEIDDVRKMCMPSVSQEDLAEIDKKIQENTVSLEELRKSTEVVEKFLLEHVTEGTSSIIPTFFIKCYCPKLDREEMGIVPVMCNFNSQEEKDGVLRMITKELFDKRKMPLSVTLLTEAWMAKMDKDEELDEEWRPGNSPNKQEVAFITSQTPEGLVVVRIAEITRGYEDKIEMGEFSTQYEGQLEGPSILSRFFSEFGKLGMAMLAQRIAANSDGDEDLNDLVEGMEDGK